MGDTELQVSRTDDVRRRFALRLTRDELDWLLFDVMQTAEENSKESGAAVEIRIARDMWFDEVSQQGYKPF